MFMEIFNNIKGIKNKISVENIVMERVFYQTKIKIFLFYVVSLPICDDP